jgi:pimeloyl-ACP methyl ester carboxylesterase
MVHGYTSSHHVWRTTIPTLEDDYYCIAIDLLGHGESDIPANGDYSIPAQGHRVIALADELGFDQFYLMGHSMGGQIALYIASQIASERVIKLIDVDGVVSARLTDYLEKTSFALFKKYYDTPILLGVEILFRTFREYLKVITKQQFGSWWHDFDSRDFDWWHIDRVYANRRGIRHVWYHGMNAIKGTDLIPHLSKISAPTLVIFGDNDGVVLLSDAHLVDEHTPESRLEIINNCGHYPMYEKETEYIKLVQDFLKK